MNLPSGIKTPTQLKEAIDIAVQKDSRYINTIWNIHKYKWYNWYQNIYIKKDSPDDVENTRIFEALAIDYPEIHKDIEDNIDSEIVKLTDEELD
jgi:hypothetical protein